MYCFAWQVGTPRKGFEVYLAVIVSGRSRLSVMCLLNFSRIITFVSVLLISSSSVAFETCGRHILSLCKCIWFASWLVSSIVRLGTFSVVSLYWVALRLFSGMERGYIRTNHLLLLGFIIFDRCSGLLSQAVQLPWFYSSISRGLRIAQGHQSRRLLSYFCQYDIQYLAQYFCFDLRNFSA